ncbi:MAG: SHOCT domain-containing protein [Chloroflexi bacterium]|nr:MAG: SHOCT domain-containing protein [Chloroflexota bacterium]TME47588.1 MAG: SHOCT domain-containing protein [Chloroflexota bacterium]
MEFFPFGGIIFLLLWFVLFSAAAGLVAYLVVPAIIQKVRHDSALVTLEQRFARGEIDSEEFKKRRQDLLTR